MLLLKEWFISQKDADEFKSTVKDNITDWMRKLRDRNIVDWMIIQAILSGALLKN